MPVTNVGSKWVGGNLIYFNKSTGATLLAIDDADPRQAVADAEFTLAAGGATDEALCTCQLVDYNGDAVAAKTVVQVWVSDAATGAGIQASASSGTVELDAGTIMATHTAKTHFEIETSTAGLFTISLVDSGNDAAYIAVKLPNGKLAVSGALVYEGA